MDDTNIVATGALMFSTALLMVIFYYKSKYNILKKTIIVFIDIMNKNNRGDISTEESVKLLKKLADASQRLLNKS